MALSYVVGLFATRGIAEDACHRLQTEGVPGRDIALEMLQRTAPVPQTMEPELEALTIDPFVWGDVHKTYVQYISNGETVIVVRAESNDDIDLAVNTIRQYAPMRIRVVEPRRGAAIGRDLL